MTTVRQFLGFTTLFLTSALITGCGYFRIDPDHYLFRSDVIESVEQERAIVAKAKLGWTPDGRVRVIYVSGTPYERGYQQGRLLREEVRENLMYLYSKILDKYHFEELLAESFERQRPFIPQEYIDEMHGPGTYHPAVCRGQSMRCQRSLSGEERESTRNSSKR